MAPKTKSKQQISRRLKWLSKPRKPFYQPKESTFVLSGVRTTALKLTKRVLEASYPCVRNLIATQERYGHVLSDRCKAALAESIENAKDTEYARFSKHSRYSSSDNHSLAYKENSPRWTEDRWNQHLERLKILAKPRTPFQPQISNVSNVPPKTSYVSEST